MLIYFFLFLFIVNLTLIEKLKLIFIYYLIFVNKLINYFYNFIN